MLDFHRDELVAPDTPLCLQHLVEIQVASPRVLPIAASKVHVPSVVPVRHDAGIPFL